MSKSLTGLDLPVRTTDPQPADVGQVEIYSKDGRVYSIDETGQIIELTNVGAIIGSQPLFIQDTQPTFNGKYLWIQTNTNGNPDDFQFFFEDGV